MPSVQIVKWSCSKIKTKNIDEDTQEMPQS